ncbi:hypothetical protein QCM77_03300 [Bradyrhizobium sp. SSUT18]|nr:hypothetical protein [Bradyrhizobium sp. SSUT18]MDH2399017.1 hypothetical protein [Bradyrhizobium sp. SSUT18]
MRQEADQLVPAVRSTGDVEEFKTIAIFCGLGLRISVLAAISYGLDLAAF